MATADLRWLSKYIRDIPDFPAAGVIYKDITPLLAEPVAFGAAVEALSDYFAPEAPSKVFGLEARGFIVGAPVAYRLGAGFVPVRKKGKLPHTVKGTEYQLEYGFERLEVHTDGVEQGESVLVIDDVLATGGTAVAAIDLVELLGGTLVGVGVLVELSYLKGRERLPGRDVRSLMRFE